MNQHLSSQDIKQRFINKQAEGTQVMAGSLKIVKGLDVHGTGTFSRVESENINATNTVTAKLFSGSGASLTNLPAGNLTGTINDARIASNVMRTNKAQTVTGNLTIGSNTTLYFAGGSAYWINKDGTARLNHATLAGDLNMEGSRNINFNSGGVGLPGTSGQKINFLDGRYAMGVNSNTLWYDAPHTHAFYASKSQIARFDASGILSHKNITASGDISAGGNLDVSGSFDAGGANIFPDPYCMDGNANLWSGGVFDSVQKPFDEAAGSMKLVATSNNHAVTYGKVFDISPGEDITISMYAMSTTTGTAGQLHIQYRNASGVLSYKTHNFTYPTRWERISVTGTAPADAISFVFRYDNDGGAGKIVYTSMFQVERSKTLTSHKGFSGSGAANSAAFSSGGLTLSKGGAVFSGFNNQFIIKDHENGNITLSAANGNLHLGYQNTGSVRLNADMHTTSGMKLADTTGVLYYKGQNTDDRYVSKTGDTVTGDLRIYKSNAWMTVESLNSGANGVEQAAGITVGESGYKGGAAMHLTYTGDGYGHIGMGSVDATTGRPRYQAMEMYYTRNTVKFFGTPDVNGNRIWHEGNMGPGSGLNADLIDGINGTQIARRDANNTFTGNQAFVSTDISGNYNNGAIEIFEVNNVKTAQSSSAYAPAISFHWAGRVSGQLALESDGTMTLRNGATHAVDKTLNAGNLQVKGSDVWHKNNMGANSGLNADLLDGKHHTDFLAKSSAHSNLDVDGLQLGTQLYLGSSGTWTNKGPNNNNANALLSMNTHSGNHYSQLWFDSGGDNFYHRSISGSSMRSWSKVWTESNDGSGSKLDADLLDGKHATSFYEKGGDIHLTAANDGIRFSAGGRIYQNSTTDSWTRFSGDIYASSNIIRTDGSLQVGNGGASFYVNSTTFKVNGSTIFSDVSGRVAINDTATTEHPLHVRSTTSYSGINLKTNSNSSTNGISFQNSGGAYTWHIARDGAGGNDPDLVFYGSAYNYSMSGLPERVRFTKDGKVGVGISNPSEMIHTSGNVQGTELIMGHPTSNTKRASWRYDSSHTFGGSSWAFIFRDDMNNKERIYIQQTASNQANISLNGNVSIGSTNTSPASPLYVDQGVSDGHITINRATTGSWTIGMPYNTFAISNGKNVTAANSHFHITTAGDVGIGLAADNTKVKSKLHVDGRTESNKGFKTGQYEIQHNTVEDSLDFLYVG